MNNEQVQFVAQLEADSMAIKNNLKTKNEEFILRKNKIVEEFMRLTPHEKMKIIMKRIETMSDDCGYNKFVMEKSHQACPDLVSKMTEAWERMDIEFEARILDLHSEAGWDKFVDQCVSPFMTSIVKIVACVNKK